jgi:hypothetical protein
MRILCAAVLGLWALTAASCQSPAPREPPAQPQTQALTAPTTGSTVAAAYRDHLDHVWVEDFGSVERLLRDDTKRPRHQRFVVRVTGGGTILIAHNIDLAPRVPCKKGDAVRFRGEYIWSEQGGTVHWTHRDPQGGKESGGWIRWRDFIYR